MPISIRPRILMPEIFIIKRPLSVGGDEKAFLLSGSPSHDQYLAAVP
jgi:hypothetical protein